VLLVAACRNTPGSGWQPADDAVDGAPASAPVADPGAAAPPAIVGEQDASSESGSSRSGPSATTPVPPADGSGLQPPAAGSGADAGLPAGADAIGGIEFFQRIVGTWSGINSNTPLGFDFPMTVEFAPTGPSFVFGKYQLDANNDVCWGFNIETYGGKNVLTFRNGGYLGGLLRDSRITLVDYDTQKGYYHFCAVLERGLPVNGCSYIDARYTFTAPDHMLFVVTTQSGKAHVHWDATRTQTVTLPTPFPASVASQGDGTAPWPPAAGIGD
jgi:hypothetical protein